ncbi:MAG TPA: DUF2079 domain-containing protein [bacterium]|nr:DUF2079 domain-containing protein [bacterium]
MKQIEKILNSKKFFYFSIIFLTLIFFIYFTLFKILNYFNFRIYWDNIDYIKIYNVIINPAKALNKYGVNTLFISAYGSNKIFFDHLYFTSLIVLPFYYLIPTNFTLSIFHIVIILSGAITFSIITKKLFNSFFAIIIFIIFFFLPTVQGSIIVTFHSSTFLLFFLPLLFYAYIFQKPKLYLISSLLIILTREDFPIIIILFNLLTIFDKQFIKYKIFLIIFSLIYFIIGFFLLLSYFSENPHQHLLLYQYYDYLGANYFDIITNIPFKIPEIINILFRKQIAFVFIIIFTPFLFLSFLNIKFLIPIIPLMFMNLLSLFPGMQDPKLYYWSPVIPFAIFSYLMALKKLNNKNQKIIFLISLIVSLIISFRWGYLPFSKYSKYYLTFNKEQYQAFKEINQKELQNEPIITSEFLALHFINNPNLYVYDKNIPPENFLVNVKWLLAFNNHKNIIEMALNYFNFKIEKKNNYFTLLKKY